MAAEVLNDFFNGLLKLIIVLVILILLLGGYFLNSVFNSSTVKTNKPLQPTMVIKKTTVNGVSKSDTTYIYDISK